MTFNNIESATSNNIGSVNGYANGSANDYTNNPASPHSSFPKNSAWKFNVSKYYKFAKPSKLQLQVATEQQKQFETICKLLKANNCEVIYFDEQFDQEQTRRLRELQKTSNTQLHNAKLAFLFEDSLDMAC